MVNSLYDGPAQAEAPPLVRLVRRDAVTLDFAGRRYPVLAISALRPWRGGREQAQGAGAGHRIMAAVDAELGVQVAPMGVDGVRGEE